MNEKAYKQRLFLLDGSALAYRAYFTFIRSPLYSPSNFPTSAVYGFTNTLLKILQEEKPDFIAVIFDRPEPTFRQDIYKEYKATREKMPDELVIQLPKIKEILEAFNIPIIELPGFEADDIIGTLARKAEQENIETYIVTSDKDMMQLVNNNIKILKPGKKGDEWEILDCESVKKYFGVSPQQVIDLLALAGDASDNIPGIRGVGQATASALIREYGNLENLYNNIDTIKRKNIRTNLIKGKKEAYQFRELVTINTSVPINVNILNLNVKDKDVNKLKILFEELGFKTFYKKILFIDDTEKLDLKKTILQYSAKDVEYTMIKELDDLNDLKEKLLESKIFVFDTETTGNNPHQAKLIGISFCFTSHKAYYVPISWNQFSEESESDELFDSKNQNNNISSQEGIDLETFKKVFSEIFSNPEIRKCGQNLKYDIIVLRRHGIEVEGIHFDTMVANYVLKPEGIHNLNDMAINYLRYKLITYNEILGKEKNLYKIPTDKVAIYSCEDADITFRLYNILKDKLKTENLLSLCERIEFPLIEVLTDMEYKGVKLDINFLKSFSSILKTMSDNYTEEIYKLAEKRFNINSSQQLSKILFTDLKLEPKRKTKTGLSTDFGVLETLKGQHPIVNKLLEYRMVTKLKSTYVDAMIKLVDPKTRRIHTSFNQTITTTGRLSSSNPNLQNIPIRTELGREIRKAFVPENDNWKILAADYSQIELRIMAHISDDPGLKEAFLRKEDIHSSTAAKIFGYELEDYEKLPKDVKLEMRRKAKEINFGIMYGLSAFGLSSRLEIDVSEADSIIKKYHQRFPNVKKYIEDTISKARSTGYVETLLGRRRYFPNINNNNAQRQAINMPIQGTAADMIKIAMINIHREIKNKPINMLLQVHDELVFEVHKDYIEEAKSIIENKMKSASSLKVPVEVDIGIGDTWYDAH